MQHWNTRHRKLGTIDLIAEAGSVFYPLTSLKSPKNKEYPYMIEIFSKKPEFIVLDENAVLTPLAIDDEISSLSAILLNDAYYDLLTEIWTGYFRWNSCT